MRKAKGEREKQNKEDDEEAYLKKPNEKEVRILENKIIEKKYSWI